LYQEQNLESTLSFMLSPVRPEMGTYLTLFFTSNPHESYRNGLSWPWIYSNLSLDQLSSSILLIITISYFTPNDLANIECSLVYPPLSNPASNSPTLDDTTSAAISA